MTTATALLVITLSHGGHCLGGGRCTVDVRWAVDAPLMPAALIWQLGFAHTTLASGNLFLNAGDPGARLTLELPTVRARAQLTWCYQLRDVDANRELERGELPLVVYPDPVLRVPVTGWEGQRVVVLDARRELATLLTAAGIPCTSIESSSGLRLRAADIVLVAADQRGEACQGDDALLEQAAAGASVLVLTQRDRARLCGYKLLPRRSPVILAWRGDHPLFADLSEADLRAWFAAGGGASMALELPSDEPALELAYWPPVVQSAQPVPLDALVLEKQIGRGRLVLCQVAATADLDDPRTRQFLANALDFLRTRPQPTPRQADRLPPPSPGTSKPGADK